MPVRTRDIPIGDDSDSGNETVTPQAAATSSSRPKGKKRTRKPNMRPSLGLSGVNMFSTEGLPKLEEFVVMDDLPDVLMVYDKSNITNLVHSTKREALVYRRIYPKPVVQTTDPRRGFLFLEQGNEIASGRRSTVHRAPFVATLGPRGEKRKRVTVAVKTAKDNCRCHHLLREEAKGYSAFPREFFTPCEPIPVGAPIRTPVPAMRSRGIFPGWGEAMRPKSPAHAPKAPPIAPKFYGFYVPVGPNGESLAQCHSSCKDYANSNCPVPHWAKSILLMEDCGDPIDPASMPYKQRDACFDLVQRMHRQGFSHGHPDPRNILVQPGPLSVAPSLRSMSSPSFRLISFGRWRALHHLLPKESQLSAKRAFEKGREIDVILAMDELRVGHVDSSDDDDDS